jgi:hypothetical protein
MDSPTIGVEAGSFSEFAYLGAMLELAFLPKTLLSLGDVVTRVTKLAISIYDVLTHSIHVWI